MSIIRATYRALDKIPTETCNHKEKTKFRMYVHHLRTTYKFEGCKKCTMIWCNSIFNVLDHSRHLRINEKIRNKKGKTLKVDYDNSLANVPRCNNHVNLHRVKKEYKWLVDFLKFPFVQKEKRYA